MIRRTIAGLAAVAIPIASFGIVARRGGRRLLEAPRYLPVEAALGGALDALGGEVVRLRSRDGLRLAGRWLPAEAASPGAADEDGATEAWQPDPHEAILVLHGWSGSIAPDLVEYGPFLRRTAGVLGLDFRGHGGSDDAPTTFGLREIEDVAGALDRLAERGIVRVALFGTSMGGIAAIAATAVLGDGRLATVDDEPNAPAAAVGPARPRIVAVVADSVTPELRVVIGQRLPGPAPRRLADRLLGAAAREIGEDLRSVEPARMLPLLEDLPVLLVHGAADTTLPLRDAQRLVERGGPGVEHWVVPGAEHGRAHATDPAAYERRVEAFLRRALTAAR